MCSNNGCWRANDNIARRGELPFDPPIGYVRRPSGEITLDPDEQVQQVVRLIFRKFDEVGTLNGVLRYLVRHDIQLGVRVRIGANPWRFGMALSQSVTQAESPKKSGLCRYIRLWSSPNRSAQATTRATQYRACRE